MYNKPGHTFTLILPNLANKDTANPIHPTSCRYIIYYKWPGFWGLSSVPPLLGGIKHFDNPIKNHLYPFSMVGSHLASKPDLKRKKKQIKECAQNVKTYRKQSVIRLELDPPFKYKTPNLPQNSNPSLFLTTLTCHPTSTWAKIR